MKKWLGIGLMLCCALIAGCDADRIAKLEKENADLKTKVEKQNAATAYDLQAKCGKDSRTWFNLNWSRDKTTALLDFTNHYSAKLNKCFILVEYHDNSGLAYHGGYSWTNYMSLWDVYENMKYADFSENHYTYLKPKPSAGDEVITCEVAQQKCKTLDEFRNLTSQYLSD
jgi:hypothetical protein